MAIYDSLVEPWGIFLLLLLSLCLVVIFYLHRQLLFALKKTERVTAKLHTQLANNCALLRAAGDGIHAINLQGDIVIANDAFANMLGYRLDEVMKMNVTQWDARWEKDELIANIPLLRNRISTFETRHRRKDDSLIDVEINSVGVEIDEVPILFCSARDISERKQTETHLLEAASVFHHAQESIVITGPDGRIRDVNEAFTKLTGYSRAEALGNYPPLTNADKINLGVIEHYWTELKRNHYWSGESWNTHKDGTVYASHLTVSNVPDASGATHSLVWIFTDITPLKEHQKQLEKIAHHDPLTQLPNRILFADRLKQAISRAARKHKPLAVIYLDLDGFKLINDKLGHDVGDSLLIDLADTMLSALRDGDSIARIGGDEFVAVLTEFDSVSACELVLERLLSSIATLVNLNGIPHLVTASIGVALYPQDGNNSDTLLRRADIAMYQAKRSGKNRYYFFDKDINL